MMEQPDMHESDFNLEALRQANSLKDLTVKDNKLEVVSTKWGRAARWFHNILGTVDQKVVKIAFETILSQKDKIKSDFQSGMVGVSKPGAPTQIDDELNTPSDLKAIINEHVGSSPMKSVIEIREQRVFQIAESRLKLLNQVGKKFFVSPSEENQAASHLEQEVGLAYRFISSPHQFVSYARAIDDDINRLAHLEVLIARIISTSSTELTDLKVRTKKLIFNLEDNLLATDNVCLERIKKKLNELDRTVLDDPEKPFSEKDIQLLISLENDKEEITKVKLTNTGKLDEFKKVMQTHLSELVLAPLEDLTVLMKMKNFKGSDTSDIQILDVEITQLLKSPRFQEKLHTEHQKFMESMDGFITELSDESRSREERIDSIIDLTEYLQSTTSYRQLANTSREEIRNENSKKQIYRTINPDDIQAVDASVSKTPIESIHERMKEIPIQKDYEEEGDKIKELVKTLSIEERNAIIDELKDKKHGNRYQNVLDSISIAVERIDREVS